MELCSVLCASLDGRGEWGRTDTCICMSESIYCLLETTTTLLISYILIKIKSLKYGEKNNNSIQMTKKKKIANMKRAEVNY